MNLTREKLKKYITRLRTMVIGMTGRPVHVVLTRMEATASTDCERTILFNPRPFEEGKPGVGFGIGAHEAGHILYSPYGRELFRKLRSLHSGLAYRVIEAIVNLILDRKDDYLTRQDFAGVRENLNERMPYLMGKPGKAERRKNAFLDFLIACKAFGRPLHPATRKCMDIIKKHIRDFRKTGPDEIIRAADGILEVLKQSCTEAELEALADRFVCMFILISGKEAGNPGISGEEVELIIRLVNEIEEEERLGSFPLSVDDPHSRFASPGEVGGIDGGVDETDVAPDPEQFRRTLELDLHLVRPLREELERLAEPDVQTVRGLEEGAIDPTQLARLSLGQDDVYSEDVVYRQDNTTLALALDHSGSMQAPVKRKKGSGLKVEYARRLGAVFNAALEGLRNTVSNSWAFNDVIWNCGPCSMGSGITGVEANGGNSDTNMAVRLVEFFRHNPAKRMVAIFVSDSGPDSFDGLREGIRKLQALGVLTVQFFIEQEGWRDHEVTQVLKGIFDHQVVFSSENIDRMIHDFCGILRRTFL